MITDEEYLQKIIKAHKRRKITGTIFLILSVIMAIFTYVFYNKMISLIAEIYESFSSILIQPGQIASESTSELARGVFEAFFYLGQSVGMSTLGMISFSATFLSMALTSFFGNRSHKIIIKLHEENLLLKQDLMRK